MKVGPAEKEKSLYDPNEVLLNAKKFDDLYKRIGECGSQEDLEDIGDKSIKAAETTKVDGDQTDSPGNGSYTNTVNSQEFREYLRKKGLLLFPVKPERKSLTSDNREIATTPTITSQQRHTEVQSDKKRNNNVFSRLSNMFTKSKTTPQRDVPETKPMFPNRIDARNLVNAPQARRKVYLETKQPNPLIVNDEFSTESFVRRGRTGRALSPDDNDEDDYEEDTKSSISSVLSAAAEDDSVFESPQPRRHHQHHKQQQQLNGQSFQNYRRINLDKSNLYQMTNDKPQPTRQQPQQQQHAIVNGAAYAIPHVNRDEPIPKPRGSVNYQQLQYNINHHDNHAVILRNSVERRSLPVSRISKPVRKSLTNDQRNTFVPITVNNVSLTPTSTSSSIVDPLTFAKINEIKLKTDEAFLKNVNNSSSSNGSRYQKMNDFIVRNDLMSQQQQHLSLSGHTTLPPRRCQSVLDDMTSKNSIYSEVTLRRPQGNNVNVIMRRTGLSTLDRKHVMDRIYEYYRKSTNNTPLSFQEHTNLKMRSQQASTSTSPPPYASTPLTSTPKPMFENLYAQPTRRRPSELTESNASNNGTMERIYDVVYGSSQTMSEVDYSRPKILTTSPGDIVINNKIYRPVATLLPQPTTRVSSLSMHQKSPAPATRAAPPPQQEGKKKLRVVVEVSSAVYQISRSV